MDTITNHILIDILSSCKNEMDYIIIRIILNSCAVLLGCKPASTVTFANQYTPYNTFSLWDRYKEVIIKNSRLSFYELHKSEKFHLILTYDYNKLNHILNECDITMFLGKLGYRESSSIENKLNILKEKYDSKIPHEIGVFLGLPLKDVRGFMGDTSLKYSCSQGWKIYNDKEPSISLFKQYELCKKGIIHILEGSKNPLKILQDYPVI